MGCASSAALPFLTNRGNQAVSESPQLNGEPPYELKMVNNKLRENGVANVKDVNEAYVTEKMKEAVDSTAVQGVLGGVVQMKDEIVDDAKGFGDAVSETLTSIVDGVEETMASALGNVNSAVESIGEKLKSEVTSMEEKIKSVVGAGKEAAEGEVKAEDIDELLDSLPTEEEVTETVKATAEEVLPGKAVDEMEGGVE